jgi:hypothetical protein
MDVFYCPDTYSIMVGVFLLLIDIRHKLSSQQAEGDNGTRGKLTPWNVLAHFDIDISVA